MGLKMDKFVPSVKDQVMAKIIGAYWDEKIQQDMY